MPGLRFWGVESERDMYYATKRNNTQTRIVGAVGVIIGLGGSGYALANGLVLRATGDRMLASPPLVISHEEVDEMARIARIALDAAWKELRG